MEQETGTEAVCSMPINGELGLAAESTKVDVDHLNDRHFVDLNQERLDYCRKLIAKFSKSGRIKCQVCQKSVYAMQKRPGLVKSDVAIQHAVLHVGRPTYRCLRCDKRTVTRGGMHLHIRQKHDLNAANGVTFVDFADRHHPAIMQWLDRCFKYDEAAAAAAGNSQTHEMVDVQKLNKNIIAGKSPVPRIRVKKGEDPVHKRNQRQRSNYAMELARNLTQGSDIICKVCVQPIRVVYNCKPQIIGPNPEGVGLPPAPAPPPQYGRFVTVHLIQHALLHLKNPFYRCRLCDVEKCTMPQFREHVYSYHGGCRCSDLCIDMTHRSQHEIIKQMADCFDCKVADGDIIDDEETAAIPDTTDDEVGTADSSSSSNGEQTASTTATSTFVQIPYVCQRCGYRTEVASLYRSHWELKHD